MQNTCSVFFCPVEQNNIVKRIGRMSLIVDLIMEGQLDHLPNVEVTLGLVLDENLNDASK